MRAVIRIEFLPEMFAWLRLSWRRRQAVGFVPVVVGHPADRCAIGEGQVRQYVIAGLAG